MFIKSDNPLYAKVYENWLNNRCPGRFEYMGRLYLALQDSGEWLFLDVTNAHERSSSI
jgi:hypothetical protein